MLKPRRRSWQRGHGDGSEPVRPMEAPMHRTLRYILTPEDRATRTKWMRLVAAFYGCAALLLLLAAIALPSASPVQPRGSAVLADPAGPGLPHSAVRRAAQHVSGGPAR